MNIYYLIIHTLFTHYSESSLCTNFIMYDILYSRMWGTLERVCECVF